MALPVLGSNRLKLNLQKPLLSPLYTDITFKCGDTSSSLEVLLYNGANPVDLTGLGIEVRFKKSDSTIVYQDLNSGVEVIPDSSCIRIYFLSNSIGAEGIVECEIVLKEGTDKVSFPSFYFTVDPNISGDSVLSETEISVIDGKVASAQAHMDSALGYSVEAKTARDTAVLKAGEAVISAGEAVGAKDQALLALSTFTTEEDIRKANEATRIGLYDIIQAKLTAGELVGAKGDKGDKGDTGLQGIQGIQGIQGVKGEAGVVITDSATNGNITVDGAEIQVYDGSGKLDKSGGSLTGEVVAFPNTDYTVAQIRNVILSTVDADVNLMNNGEIWIKYV